MTGLIIQLLSCITMTGFKPEDCAEIVYQIVARQDTEEEAVDNNPYNYTIGVMGFPYDSIANEIVNYRYDQSHGDIDMILTFIAENGAFDHTKVSKTNDRGLCQLHWNKTNRKWIEDERWSDPMYQAEVCVDKWLAVPNPSKIWYGWKVRERYKKQIYYFD